jgi:hypothetical protein
MSRKRVPWDGPNPAPGDYLDCKGGSNLWLIRAVEPLRRPDVSGARICLDVVSVARSTLPEAATVHPANRVALSDPAGPARVRQITQGPKQVMRAAWRDPEDFRLQARRAREINGWRTVCQLRRLQSLSGNSRITERHIAVGDHLRLLADLAAYGMSSTDGILPVTAVSYGPRAGPSANAEISAQASVDLLRGMRRVTDAQRWLVIHVVLLHGTLSSWCAEMRFNAQNELGYLIAALDLLDDHFHSEVDEALGDQMVRAA